MMQNENDAVSDEDSNAFVFRNLEIELMSN